MTGSLTAQRSDPLAVFEKLLPESFEEGFSREERLSAFEALRDCGLPHRKVEAWKYTDPSGAVTGPFDRPHHCGYGLTSPDSVRIGMLRTFPDIGKNHPFALLSHALSHGGLELVVPAHTVVDEPVQIRLPVVQPGSLLCPALKIKVGTGSKVDFIVRSEEQGADSLVSQVTQMTVAENANVSFTRLRSGQGAHFHLLLTQQAADSRLTLFDSTVGGALTRNDLHAELKGRNAEIDLYGLYLLDGTGHADNHTTVSHSVPYTYSRQLYKGILDDHACGVFNGRVVVQPGACGSDALQMNRNLLSGKAKVDTKPQLEIGNDDVRCSHGATIGRLDEAQIFYLRSRGLDRSAAEALLARGFAGEVIDLAPAGAQDVLNAQIEEFFEREAEG
ncbi:Fe-S cluster assembly protein SufD [Tichowtungia aerotolerans]|uniref:Fe-S cluster assembly protein SufD n=1 Tax=Tichowtungia aerotolerans TaxID=2697043 RepID=A0A6P1MFB0_9BACT|nr:Fe-S cluster assembly protein SufD [Tichowtungia aerotolerans]QHI69755.1 Fe-S cluster assembly protein SufD [Tichowtungia aerotolerans]